MKQILIIFIILIAIFGAVYMFGGDWIQTIFDASASGNVDSEPAAKDLLFN